MADTILHQIVRKSPKLAASTRTYYLTDIDDWVEFAGANPGGWTRTRTAEWYAQLLRTMQPQSANRKIASLAYAASWWAKQQNDPQLNFAVIEKAGKIQNAPRVALTPEDTTALIDTCKANTPIDLRDRALIVMGLETGMRRMSLGALQIENLTKAREGYPIARVPIKGSGDALYPVPLSDLTVIAIEPWRKWLRSKRVTSGPLFRPLSHEIARGGKLVYELDGDDGLALASIYRIVTRRADKAGLVHLHPHVFRHTFITWRMQAGLAPYQVAAITGHKMTGLGMGAFGGYIDAARVGDEARNHTPAWLSQLVRSA